MLIITIMHIKLLIIDLSYDDIGPQIMSKYSEVGNTQIENRP